jgi:hypothetical protein
LVQEREQDNVVTASFQNETEKALHAQVIYFARFYVVLLEIAIQK